MSHIEHRLADGSTVRATPEAMQTVLAVEAKMAGEEKSWKARLRELGVVAAHPDDGWVRRVEGSIYHSPTDDPSVLLEYPQFRDKRPEVGDLIALGWPGDATRIVRVNRVADDYCRFGDMTRYHFDPEPVISWPRPGTKAEPAPRSSWLRRLFPRAHPGGNQ